jgi:rhamnose utilization protein RhaD (predicted bifunctional aldolase and dehydrogenase)
MTSTPEEELIFLCNLFGSCSKRSQGAGGNISVKDRNNLYIKASGVRLTSVNKNSGYVACDLSGVSKLFENNIEQLDSIVSFGKPQKPSMETFLHLLPLKYVVHFHSSYICKFLCTKQSQQLFTNKNFPNSMYIPYVKPGILLAKKILPKWNGETILFLENHGIVLLGDTIKNLVFLYKNLVELVEQYTYTKDTSSPIESEYSLIIKSGTYIKPIYSVKDVPTSFLPISPDHFLFLQKAPLVTNLSNLEEDLDIWTTTFASNPSFIKLDNQLYASGKNWEDCYNKEEYLLSYFDIITESSSCISNHEQELLLKCPKEIFRLHNQ